MRPLVGAAGLRSRWLRMRRHSWVLPVSVAALVGLLGLLGTLQVRWLDRVAETIATEKRQSLLRRGSTLATALERELTRAYLWFVLDDQAATAAPAEVLSERWASWREAGRSVPLIKQILLARRGPLDEGPALQVLHAGDRKLLARAWPESLQSLRDELARRPAGFGPPRMPLLREADDDPLLLVPVPDPERDALVVLVLDGTYLTTTLWPELAQEHLGAAGDGTPVMAWLRRSDRAVVSWPRGADAGNLVEHAPIPILGVRPDLAAPGLLFGVRPPPSLADGRFPPQAGGPARGPRFGPHRRPPPPRPGESRGAKQIWRGGPGEPPVLLGPPALPWTGMPMAPPPAGRGRPDFREPPPGGPPRPNMWMLSLAYAGGPVDRLVDSVRRRNLAISFGILGVLAGAIGVLALAFRRAQRLAARQQEFLASVSHELRTPLAVIGSAAENLRDGTVEERARVREYGAMIGEESRRLTAMVDDVLRLAAGQSVGENLRLEVVDARVVVDSAVDSLQPEIQARGGRVERVDPERAALVSADPQALRQVVENVVGNALKYGGERPAVTVRIAEVQAPDGPEVEIAVSDRGLGIPPAEMGQIFEPFFRGQEALRRQIHGTGLGLSLVARVMKAHGGRVTVQSTPGLGSSFALRLPAAEGQA
jgi:signal transduction histidine kinase